MPGHEGHDHSHGVTFAPEIDRDVTAIVVAILQQGTVDDFTTIMGDPARAPAMLLRACQFLVMSNIQLAHSLGVPEEVVADIVLENFQHALLRYAGLNDAE